MKGGTFCKNKEYSPKSILKSYKYQFIYSIFIGRSFSLKIYYIVGLTKQFWQTMFQKAAKVSEVIFLSFLDWIQSLLKKFPLKRIWLNFFYLEPCPQIFSIQNKLETLFTPQHLPYLPWFWQDLWQCCQKIFLKKNGGIPK